MEPEDIRFSLEQYQTVICELTDGLMSKLNYYATDRISLVRDRFCDHCDLRDGEQEAQRDYEQNVEYAQYCERHEPTYDPKDGSM